MKYYLIYKSRNLAFTILLLLSFIFLNSCNLSSSKRNKPVISVSILPQKYFVQKIAQNNYEINVLVPPGASPANYDPTPNQLVQLSDSKIYFKIGHIEFEKNWMNKFTKEYPELEVIDTSDGLDLLENKESHSDHNHGWIEPHIWMSPKNVKKIALNIYQALIKIDEKNKTFYKSNFDIFISEIEALNKSINLSLNEIKSNKFIIYHPALTYYAADFGLEQISIELEGKNPSAYYIKQLIDIAKEENIKVVLVQKQFDKSKAETIAKEIGGQVITIDPLDYNWPNQLLEISFKLGKALNQ